MILLAPWPYDKSLETYLLNFVSWFLSSTKFYIYCESIRSMMLSDKVPSLPTRKAISLLENEPCRQPTLYFFLHRLGIRIHLDEYPQASPSSTLLTTFPSAFSGKNLIATNKINVMMSMTNQIK
jgi:hypothetical protein